MTPAQNALIKTAVLADSTLSAAVAIQDWPLVAIALNATYAPAYTVWRSSTPAASIADAITWANLTPVDAADVTILMTNRVLICQAKQINLQIMLQGRESVTSNKANLRAGLQDALTAIPSGANGVSQGAGWNAVKAAMTRSATYAEKILATGAGTAASPSDLGFEGQVTGSEVQAAMV
jgi:hypothetical protein